VYNAAMTELGAALVMTLALVGCGGGSGGSPSTQSAPCSFTVSGGPGGQFACIVAVQYSSASGLSELTMGVTNASPFDGITISAGEQGMVAAQSTWTNTDSGAVGAIELTQGGMIWGAGSTSPPQGSYSFAFSSASVDVSTGGDTVYNVHGQWSAVAPPLPGETGTTLNLTGSF